MQTTLGKERARVSPSTHANASLLFLLVALAPACSFDQSRLRAPSSRAPDGAIDHPATDAAQAGTGGSAEVGQVDSGATHDTAPDRAIDNSAAADAEEAGGKGNTEAGQVDSGAADQSPPTAGIDAALGQDCQDSSGTAPDVALDGAIDNSAEVDAEEAGTEGVMEVGQVDSGATDQSPPTDGSDAALGRDSGTSPDTTTDTSPAAGIVADGTYRIIARHSGKALDVYYEYTADGSNVDQWTYDGGNNQRWAFTHLGGNVYEILGVQSGKALEVATTSTADDTNVDIRTYTGAPNQQWTISALDGGYFRLTPMSSSGSALDVGGVSLSDGANVHQWTWLGGTNQQWSLQTP